MGPHRGSGRGGAAPVPLLLAAGGPRRYAADPFGSRPTVRRRGWLRVALGAALLAGCVALAISGISGAVDSREELEEDAVGHGTVREGLGEPVPFVVPEGERREYSVYLLFGGIESNSDVQELAVRDTGCVAHLPDGAQTRFRGARQDVSTTIGSASSVGHFSSQPGAVFVRCGYVSGAVGSESRRPGAVPYIVTPGSPGEVGAHVLAIIGGVFGAIGGGALLLWGWHGRRVPAG